MSTKSSGTEQRKTARFDVSLPVRFTEDGENFSEGVVTSISTIGMFIQTQRVPALSGSVWFDVGFGGGLAPVRGRAKVGTLNRRFGTDVVTGFGIEFENPRDEVGELLAELEPVYPGAVKLDTQGSLVWPIALDPGRPGPGHEGDGLRIGWKGGWVGPGGDGGTEAAAVAIGASLNRPIQDYLEMVRDLNPQILACDEELLPFAYQGRTLGPAQGIAKGTLIAGLMALDHEQEARSAGAPAAGTAAAVDPEAGGAAEPAAWSLDLSDEGDAPSAPPPAAHEPAPAGAEPKLRAADAEAARGRALLDLLAAQMRIIDDLSCGGWRLEHMWSEQLDSIDQGSALFEDAAARLAAAGGQAREPASDTLGGMDAVRGFVARVLWNARAITPSDDVFRAYDDFTHGQREAEAEARVDRAVARRKMFDAAPGATATVRVRTRGKTPVWEIVAVVVLVAGAAAAGYWSLQRSKERLDEFKVRPGGQLTVDAIEQGFAESKTDIVSMTIDAVESAGTTARVTVPLAWVSKPKARRQREAEVLCSVLADRGYVAASIVTSEGIVRAEWKKGVLKLVE